jgi:hypothetical protein
MPTMRRSRTSNGKRRGLTTDALKFSEYALRHKKGATPSRTLKFPTLAGLARALEGVEILDDDVALLELDRPDLLEP